MITILYYSSNREKPEFEQRIKDDLLSKCGDLPIISVTQKPIDLGKNICVGDVGASGFNMFRQVLLGCKEAKTKYVLSAEADCVYPPEYFTWIPPREDKCYRNTNLYVMGQHRKYFYQKGFKGQPKTGATHAQIVGREFYIKTLEKLFEGEPMWSVEQKSFPKEKSGGKMIDIFASHQMEPYHLKNPVVQIKTSQSMRNYTKSDRTAINELPYWGNGADFRNKFYDIGYIH